MHDQYSLVIALRDVTNVGQPETNYKNGACVPCDVDYYSSTVGEACSPCVHGKYSNVRANAPLA